MYVPFADSSVRVWLTRTLQEPHGIKVGAQDVVKFKVSHGSIAERRHSGPYRRAAADGLWRQCQ